MSIWHHLREAWTHPLEVIDDLGECSVAELRRAGLDAAFARRLARLSDVYRNATHCHRLATEAKANIRRNSHTFGSLEVIERFATRLKTAGARWTLRARLSALKPDLAELRAAGRRLVDELSEQPPRRTEQVAVRRHADGLSGTLSLTAPHYLVKAVGDSLRLALRTDEHAVSHALQRLCSRPSARGTTNTHGTTPPSAPDTPGNASPSTAGTPSTPGTPGNAQPGTSSTPSAPNNSARGTTNTHGTTPPSAPGTPSNARPGTSSTPSASGNTSTFGTPGDAECGDSLHASHHRGGPEITLNVVVGIRDLAAILDGTGDDVRLALTNGSVMTGAQLLESRIGRYLNVGLFSPQGPINLYRTARFANSAQRTLAAMRDPACAVDGCSVGATDCEINHNTPWSKGGETNMDNLSCTCPFHNGWTDLDPDENRHGRIVQHDGINLYQPPGDAPPRRSWHPAMRLGAMEILALNLV